MSKRHDMFRKTSGGQGGGLVATGLTASQGLHWPHPARYRLLRPRHPVQSCHLVDDDTEAQSLVQAHATVEGKRHRSDPGCQSPELGLSAELYPLALLSPATSGPPSPRGEGGEERGPPWSPHLEPAPGARTCRRVQAQAGSAPVTCPRLSPSPAPTRGFECFRASIAHQPACWRRQ